MLFASSAFPQKSGMTHVAGKDIGVKESSDQSRERRVVNSSQDISRNFAMWLEMTSFTAIVIKLGSSPIYRLLVRFNFLVVILYFGTDPVIDKPVKDLWTWHAPEA